MRSILLLFFLLFSVSVWSKDSCPLFMAGKENLSKFYRKNVSQTWTDFNKTLENSNERSLKEWYLANILSDSRSLFKNKIILNSSDSKDYVKKVFGKKGWEKINEFYNSKVFQDVDNFNYKNILSEIEKVDLSGKGIYKSYESPNKIKSNLLELEKKLANVDDSDLRVETILDTIFNLKQSGDLVDDVYLNMLSHKILANEGLLPYVGSISEATTKIDFKEQMIEKIVMGQLFIDDIKVRNELNLKLKNSIIPHYHELPTQISVSTNKGAQRGFIDFDPEDFINYALRNNDGKKTFNDVLEDYKKVVDKWAVEFIGKNEIDDYALREIPEDFQKVFYEVTAKDPSKWHAKMNKFYRKDELLYRGQSTADIKNDDDILKMFISTNRTFLSQRAKRGMGIIKKPLIDADFSKFNKLLRDDNKTLVKYVYDHMTEGPLYMNSFLFSSSKKRAVGVRFSKGFLQNSARIKEQRSQIIVEFMRRDGFGEIDINRLGSVIKGQNNDLSFASKYGRQVEVSTVGGISPDAVMRIEVKDVDDIIVSSNTNEAIGEAGKILKTRVFERNPEKPNIFKLTTTEGEVESIYYYKLVDNSVGLNFKKVEVDDF